MRVLIATDAWKPQVNGVVRTLIELEKRAEQVGFELRFITPDQFRTIAMPGYPEIRLALRARPAIARLFDEFRPDAVHVATEGPIGLAARRIALVRGVPFTTSYHTRFPEYLRARAPVPTSLSYAWLRWFHCNGQGIMTSTASLDAELRARDFKPLMRWSRGVDIDLFHPREKSAYHESGPVFLSVGRVAVEKNLEAFLSLDLPGSKVVVGDGPALNDLRARYPAVTFLGALHGEALAEAYASADVFVFPSRTDTFGLVIIEALASGLPVAAFPVMGPRDILTDPAVGVLHEDLRAACLGALSLDPARCVAFARRYSWDASAAQFASNVRLAYSTYHARLKKPGGWFSARLPAAE